MGRKYSCHGNRLAGKIIGVISLVAILGVFVAPYYLDNMYYSGASVETSPAVEAVPNVLTMLQVNTKGIAVEPQSSLMVELNGTAEENTYIPLAQVETARLESDRSYTIKVMSSTTFFSILLCCSDDEQIGDVVLNLGAVEAWREGIEIAFNVPQEAQNQKYLRLCAYVASDTELKSAQVYMAANEGEGFLGWDKLCSRKYDNPEYAGTWKQNGQDNMTRKVLLLDGDSSLRYAVATDIHWNHDDSANTGLDGDAKTQLFVDAINAEHHKKPLDFLMITGDINEGGGKAALQEFKDKFLWQFEMPVILFPGNHDGISESDWLEVTGYNRQDSFETDDFYFIYVDVYGDNLGKTWLSHWAAHYDSGEIEAYITCDAADEGALLVGTDIAVDDVTPTMRGWSNVAKVGNYVKLAKAKDADMYKAPSLDYVKREVEKAGNKYIVFLNHQMLTSYEDGDTEGVISCLKGLDNYLMSIEGHCHRYMDIYDSQSDSWLLNSGHFVTPMGGWDKVAANNYMGFRVIEVENGGLATYKVQPTQAVGTVYEYQYSIIDKKQLFPVVIVN